MTFLWFVILLLGPVPRCGADEPPPQESVPNTPAGLLESRPFQTPAQDPEQIKAQISRRLQDDRSFAQDLAEALLRIPEERTLTPTESPGERARTEEDLIRWIQSHPFAATDIYLSLKAERAAFNELVLKYWEINPNRSRISYDDLKDAARASARILASSLSDEQVRELAQGVFEPSRPQAGAISVQEPWRPSLRPFSFPARDWSLRREQARREGRRAAAFLGAFGRALETNRFPRPPSEERRRRAQLGSTRKSVEDFFSALQRAEDKKRITAQEAQELERRHLRMRRELLLSYVQMKRDQISLLASACLVPQEVIKAYRDAEEGLSAGKDSTPEAERSVAALEREHPWLTRARLLEKLPQLRIWVRFATQAGALGRLLDAMILWLYPDSEYASDAAFLSYLNKFFGEIPVSYFSDRVLDQTRQALSHAWQSHRTDDLIQDIFFTSPAMPGLFPLRPGLGPAAQQALKTHSR